MLFSESAQRRIVWIGATAAVCAIGIAFVYWPIISTGLSFVSSDIYDGKIMIAILEHWYNVYRLKEAPLTAIYFHPFTATLAYNDSNLISGAIYSIFRSVGADPLLAYEFMNWVVRIIGCVGAIAFSSRVLKLSMVPSLASGLLVMIVTNLALQMGHAQLLFASLFPFGLLLFTVTFERMRRASEGASLWPALLSTTAFAVLIYAWAMTAFYPLYIFCLFLAVFFGFLNLLSTEVRAASVLILERRPKLVAFSLATLALAALGVLFVYGKALTGGHSIEAMRHFAGRPMDLLNVGSGNLWSNVLAPIYRALTGAVMENSEHATGFTPLLAIAFVATTIWLFRRRKTNLAPDAAIALALALACIVIAFLTLRTSGRAHWEPFFSLVPGAKALRVPMRFLLFIGPVVILVAVYGISRLRPAWAAIILLLVAVEQYRNDQTFGLDRTAEMAILNSVSTPPAACRSFYVSVPNHGPTGNPPIDSLYIHSVDAMLIAEFYAIPTVNGMSTFTPTGWDLHTPLDPGYRARVVLYAERMGIAEGLCSLDLKARKWGPA